MPELTAFFATVVIALVVALGILAVLLPYFVYKIHTHVQQIARELHTLVVPEDRAEAAHVIALNLAKLQAVDRGSAGSSIITVARRDEAHAGSPHRDRKGIAPGRW
jgi:hypothetical protein